MRVKPDPGNYRITLPGISATLTITPTGATIVLSSVMTLSWEWEDDEHGPYLDGLGRIGFTPPDIATWILRAPDGSEVYVGGGTYAPI